jgi:hypothetical protein
MDEIVQVQFDIENVLDKSKCASLVRMALLSNQVLAQSIQVNGTKAYFINSDGVDVDVSYTPLLVASLNQDLIQKQSEGSLSPNSKNMY